jgi:hypothetical protein
MRTSKPSRGDSSRRRRRITVAASFGLTNIFLPPSIHYFIAPGYASSGYDYGLDIDGTLRQKEGRK